MIEFENVTLRYKHHLALDDVSFTLKENTICGVLGRNGAGKTSLFALLAAYRKPTLGAVRVFGENPYENPVIMPKITFVFDKDETNNSFTILETLKLTKTFRSNFDEDYAKKLLKRFELPHKKALSGLSHGQRSAVRAAIGLASRCEVTIFDEAYSGMDAAFRKIFVRELLEDFADNPRTILFSTHYINEMSGIFNDVLILDKGKVTVFDDCEALRQNRLSTKSATLQDLFIELTGGIDDENIERLT